MERRRGNSRKDNRRGGNYREENKNNKAAVYRPKPKKNQTTETGFTGGPDTWFDDVEYNKGLCAMLSQGNHDYYFGSYSNFYIHEEMLKDRVRTEAYRHSIEDNHEFFKDKIVMDIGAGTGILSIFAARAGAKHVYAIENAEIAHFAREIINKNSLTNQITVLKGKMEEIELPVPKVDIIISEWMGYFLLYESMLDTVIWARDKYLNKGGRLLPNRATIYIAGVEDGKFKANKLSFWDNVYGVDMKCMRPAVMKEPLIDSIDSQMINTNECKILDLDLENMKAGDVEFTAPYELTFHRHDKCHGIVAWFDTDFERMPYFVSLSTSPYKKYTHWKQTVFYFDDVLTVRKGDKLYGSIAVRKSRTNFREIDLKISYHFHNGFQDIDNPGQLFKVK